MPVAFSIPNYPSLFELEKNQMPVLFIPNLKFLLKFVEGDLGIAKKITTNLHLTSLSQVKDASVLQSYLKTSGAKLPGKEGDFFINGKFTPPSTVNLEQGPNNLGGLGALEKALIQSIFETQKQYFEIAKLVAENFIFIEDIVAQVLGLATPSLFPKANPRALGYGKPKTQAGGGIGRGLAILKALQKKPGPKNPMSNPASPMNVVGLSPSTVDESPTIPIPPPYSYVTQSIVYSTGEFKSDVEYNYVYRDIFEEFLPDIEDESNELDPEDETGKEEILVLAVFDSFFQPLPLTDPKIDKFVDWLKPKYRNNIWPQIKESEDFDYFYEVRYEFGGLAYEETNVGVPPAEKKYYGIAPAQIEKPWKIKVYREDDGPRLNLNFGGESINKSIKKGQKALAYNSDRTKSLLEYYKVYYIDYATKEIDKALAEGAPRFYDDENGNQIDVRQKTLEDITAKVSDFTPSGSIPIHIEGLLENNFMVQSAKPGNTVGLPSPSIEGGRYFFSTYINNIEEKRQFPAFAFKVAKNKDGIWVDPEAEYDMKIIKCDASRDITFFDIVGEPERKAIINRFIRKNLTIRSANNIDTLSFLIKNPDSDTEYFKFENLRTASIDFFVDNPTVALPLNDTLLFGIVELGRNFPYNPIRPLIRMYKKRFEVGFGIFWYKTTYTKFKFVRQNDRYKLVGYKENIYNLFLKRDFNTSNSQYSSDYKTFKPPGGTAVPLVMEVQVGTAAYDLLISQFPDELTLSKRIEEIPFSAPQLKILLDISPVRFVSLPAGLHEVFIQGVTNNQLFEFNFNGKKLYVTEESDGYYFLGERKDININTVIPNDGIIRTVTYNVFGDLITNSTEEAVSNIVRIQDMSTGTAKSRLISNINITNDQLRFNTPFAKGEYGSPGAGEGSDNSATQVVEQIYRYQKTIDDVETFYIIEAIRKSKNSNPLLSPSEREQAKKANLKSGGIVIPGVYTWRMIFLVIPKFIRLAIKIAVKLVPSIQLFINLITNPAKFITDIIIAKLGDDFGAEIPKFGFYSKEFMQQLSKVRRYCDELKATKFNYQQNELAKERLDAYLNQSLLKNYVFIADDGTGRFVLDGTALLKLFGDAPILQGLPSLSFGIETNFSSLITANPKSPVRLIFSIDRTRSKTAKGKADFLGNTRDRINDEILDSQFFNAKLSPRGPLDIKNQIISESNGVQTIEEVSIQYSTGEFREDVQYEYIYLTEEIENLIKVADRLIDIGDVESLAEAQALLEQAEAKDRTNRLIKQKLESLKKLKKIFSSQPLLDFMLNLVALPLKVILGIIKFILDFFKALANPFELPGKIIDFVSFKWLLDFFSPISKNSMFAMAGILFDIQTFFQVWLPSAAAGTKFSFNLNDIIKLPWATWPTYSLDEFRAIFKFPPIPILILTSILCLIEAIINSFIDFIWAIFGMVDPETGRWIVIKPPYIRFCKDTNKKFSPKDVIELLNGSIRDLGKKYPEPQKNPSTAEVDDDNTFNFVYDVQTSDGRSLLDLDDKELDQFLEENKDLQFTFNFDRT